MVIIVKFKSHFIKSLQVLEGDIFQSVKQKHFYGSVKIIANTDPANESQKVLCISHPVSLSL